MQFNEISGKYSFTDVYKIANNFPLEISAFGTADARTNSSELQVTQKFRSKLTRKNLQGIELRCVLVVR